MNARLKEEIKHTIAHAEQLELLMYTTTQDYGRLSGSLAVLVDGETDCIRIQHANYQETTAHELLISRELLPTFIGKLMEGTLKLNSLNKEPDSSIEFPWQKTNY